LQLLARSHRCPYSFSRAKEHAVGFLMNLNSTNVTRYRFATWNWIARARQCAEIQTRQCGSRVRKRKRRESNDVFGHSRRSFRIRDGEFADAEARNALQFGLANSRRCASGFAISRWQSNERINATRNTACQPGLPPVRTRTANRSLASFPGVKTRDRAASCSLARVIARLARIRQFRGVDTCLGYASKRKGYYMRSERGGNSFAAVRVTVRILVHLSRRNSSRHYAR